MNEEVLFNRLVKGTISEDEYKCELIKDKLKVGTRVVATDDYEGARIKGKKGVIKAITSPKTCAVEFDDPIEGDAEGHSCNGRCDAERGWFVKTSLLNLLESEVENVTSDSI